MCSVHWRDTGAHHILRVNLQFAFHCPKEKEIDGILDGHRVLEFENRCAMRTERFLVVSEQSDTKANVIPVYRVLLNITQPMPEEIKRNGTVTSVSGLGSEKKAGRWVVCPANHGRCYD